MLRNLLPIVPLLCLAALARAEINIVDSVEWMAVDSAVAEGHIISVTTQPVRGMVKAEVASAHCECAYKIALPAERAGAIAATGHAYLFFIKRGGADLPRELGLCDALRDPLHGVIDLEKPEGVYSADMRLLTKGDEILALAQKWSEWKKPTTTPAPALSHSLRVGPPGSLRLDIPPDAPIFRQVYAGSACYITVPAEEKYRERAMKLIASTQPYDRAEGAALLAAFPGQETVKALTALLDDKAETMSILGGTNIGFSYRVRPAAYEALAALGQKPAKPEFNRVPTPDERIRVLRGYWQDRLGPILPAGWQFDDVTIADAPGGWTHTKGGDGLALLLRQPKETLHDPMVGDYHSSLTVFVMSSDWEGENKHYKGEKIEAGKYTPPREQFADAQVYPARYIGQKEGYVRVFVTTVGRGGWDTADDQIGKRLELKK